MGEGQACAGEASDLSCLCACGSPMPSVWSLQSHRVLSLIHRSLVVFCACQRAACPSGLLDTLIVCAVWATVDADRVCGGACRLRIEDPVELDRNLAMYLNRRTHAHLHLECARCCCPGGGAAPVHRARMGRDMTLALVSQGLCLLARRGAVG